MGTTKGGHLYLEAPDQSSNPAARMDGVTVMDGTSTLQGDWAPIDLGKFPYVAAEQPWTIEIYTGLDPLIPHDLRVYVSSYSDDVDTPLVRFGEPGATPSVVVTIPAEDQRKPNSGSNITPFLVTGISGSVSAAVSVGGKLRRPIGITVDLSGLSTHRPAGWSYQLLGFVNGDLSQDPILASGYITQDGLVPAGPDGIDVPHTFGPEEPTSVTSITVYAVAGLAAGSRLPSERGIYKTSPGFTLNNIVPGITASCVVSIGATTGVIDPTQNITALLSSVFGTVSGVFDITTLAIDTARLANLSATAAKLASAAVTTSKLAALAVDAAALATSSVTSTKIASAAVGTAAIANLAVGTAAIQTGAITTALIANLAVGSAQIANLAVGTSQIANLAVTDAKINDLNVSKLTAGTITVSGTGTAVIVCRDSGTSIKSSLFPGAFTAQYGSGVTGLIAGCGGGSDAAIDMVNSIGGNGITITTFLPGITINGVKVLGPRVFSTPTTLAQVISILQTHGLCS